MAVLGNHDYLTDVELVRRCIREVQVEEVTNDFRTLRRGDAALHLSLRFLCRPEITVFTLRSSQSIAKERHRTE